MGFSVNTNAGALAALSTLNQTNRSLEKTQERINTGFKVNGARDNASTFAIAQGMRGDIAGLKAVQDSNLDVFAIGVGSEIDQGTLSRIGRNGYALASDSGAIVNAFAAVTERIVHWTQSHYLLSYCSPSRSGTHEVTIEAISETEGSGRLTYQFDAAGFGPRCNPQTPPPFDTSGRRGFKPRRQERTGIRLEVNASASVGGG